MYKVTIDDAKRLLSADEFLKLKEFNGDRLESILSHCPYPPEMGIASEDEYKRVMLNGLLSTSCGELMPLGKIPGIGCELGMIQKLAGESKEDMYQRLEKLTGGRVVRY